MKRALFIRLIAVIAAAFMLGACSPTRALEIGEDAPDFSLKDLEGRMVKLSDFKGKVVILDFFATWCPPCKAEVPDFINLQNSYGDKDFTMVGVALVDQNDARAFVSRMGINYPVLLGDEAVNSVYGPIRAIPTTFVIDRNLRVAKIYVGYKAKEVFEADVRELLK